MPRPGRRGTRTSCWPPRSAAASSPPADAQLIGASRLEGIPLSRLAGDPDRARRTSSAQTLLRAAVRTLGCSSSRPRTRSTGSSGKPPPSPRPSTGASSPARPKRRKRAVFYNAVGYAVELRLLRGRRQVHRRAIAGTRQDHPAGPAGNSVAAAPAPGRRSMAPACMGAAKIRDHEELTGAWCEEDAENGQEPDAGCQRSSWGVTLSVTPESSGVQDSQLTIRSRRPSRPPSMVRGHRHR